MRVPQSTVSAVAEALPETTRNDIIRATETLRGALTIADRGDYEGALNRLKLAYAQVGRAHLPTATVGVLRELSGFFLGPLNGDPKPRVRACHPLRVTGPRPCFASVRTIKKAGGRWLLLSRGKIGCRS